MRLKMIDEPLLKSKTRSRVESNGLKLVFKVIIFCSTTKVTSLILRPF